ncbi:MAG TPA: transposase [Gaiellaceae bacterium]|nr:transposase [Gaiellaceae bacterium]
MPRFPRSQLEGGYFHVTARGAGNALIFVADLDRLDFLHLLESTTRRLGWRALAHCLMGTHYHLILEATRESLSAGMQRLNGVYALRFNRRHGRTGHLFAERFSSYVIRDERHLEAAVEYVLQNPVRAGLCDEARDWAWAAAA